MRETRRGVKHVGRFYEDMPDADPTAAQRRRMHHLVDGWASAQDDPQDAHREVLLALGFIEETTDCEACLRRRASMYAAANRSNTWFCSQHRGVS